MTDPRPLGNVMAGYRNGAAEHTNQALMKLDRLIVKIQNGEFTRNGLVVDMVEISRALHISMRHLEKMGAKTQPPE